MDTKVQDRFSVGRYWLSQRSGSACWYRTCFDAGTRQTARTSLGTESFEEAKLRLAEWVVKHAEVRDRRPQDTGFESVLIRYYEHHGANLESAEFVRIAIGKLAVAFAGKSVSDLGLAAQESFQKKLAGDGLSDGYIRRIMGVAKAALTWAYKRQELTNVPYINLPDNAPARDRLLTLSEARSLWRAAELDHERMFLALAFNTLSRPEALLDVTREMADFDHRLLALNPPERKQQLKKWRPTVPITVALMPVLQAAPAGHLVRWRAKPIASFKTAFRSMRKRAGLSEDIIAKDIRYTIATEMRKAGVPEAEIQGFLGHRAYKGETERYAKYRPDYLGQAAKVVDEYVERVTRT